MVKESRGTRRGEIGARLRYPTAEFRGWAEIIYFKARESLPGAISEERSGHSEKATGQKSADSILVGKEAKNSGKAVSSPLIQAKEELFYLGPTHLGKSSAFTDPCESAFFQGAQRAGIVFSSTSVHRTQLVVL